MKIFSYCLDEGIRKYKEILKCYLPWITGKDKDVQRNFKVLFTLNHWLFEFDFRNFSMTAHFVSFEKCPFCNTANKSRGESWAWFCLIMITGSSVSSGINVISQQNHREDRFFITAKLCWSSEGFLGPPNSPTLVRKNLLGNIQKWVLKIQIFLCDAAISHC